MANRQDDVLKDAQLTRDKARQSAKRVQDETAMTDAAKIQFLNTETDTGLTLARIASQAKDATKKRRNQQNARRAFDTVLDHLESVAHLGDKLDSIQEKMKKLKQMLVSLGEKI